MLNKTGKRDEGIRLEKFPLVSFFSIYNSLKKSAWHSEDRKVGRKTSMFIRTCLQYEIGYDSQLGGEYIRIRKV